MAQPLNYLRNIPGETTCTWAEFKGDTTQQQFKLMVNDTPVHSYLTPLVHNGFRLDVSFQYSLMVGSGDKLRIDKQAYANVADTVVLDFDDDNNPNTLLKFYK